MTAPRGPDPGDEPPNLKLIPVARAPRLLPAIVALVAVGVALAVWKPWAPPAPPPAPRTTPASSAPAANVASPSPGGQASPSASVAVTPSPGTAARGIACISETDWRVVTLERAERRETRTWIAVEPYPARDPLDRRIEAARIVSSQLVGLGYCAPLAVSEATSVRIWRLTPGAAGAPGSAIPLAPPVRAAEPGPGLSELFAPPPGLQAWPPARYVIQVVGEGVRPGGEWLALDVVPARPAPRP